MKCPVPRLRSEYGIKPRRPSTRGAGSPRADIQRKARRHVQTGAEIRFLMRVRVHSDRTSVLEKYIVKLHGLRSELDSPLHTLATSTAMITAIATIAKARTEKTGARTFTSADFAAFTLSSTLRRVRRSRGKYGWPSSLRDG